MTTLHCAYCGRIIKRPIIPHSGNTRYFCSRECWYSPERRFWENVEFTETCWIWHGSLGRKDYGRIKVYGKAMSAHRYAWELLKGRILDGLWVLHNCPGGDNPRCVNPGHLYLGTFLDNIKDAHQKHQFQRGEEVHTAKLSEYQVKEIRSTWEKAGRPFRHGIKAERYGVGLAQIGNILHRRTWTHVV